MPHDFLELLRARQFREGFAQGDALEPPELFHLPPGLPVHGGFAPLLLTEEIPEIQTDDNGKEKVDQPQNFHVYCSFPQAYSIYYAQEKEKG